MKQLLILLVILSSCSQSPSKSNSSQGIGLISDSLGLDSDSLFIPTYVIDQIVEHYNDTALIMKTENTDSSVSIVWYFSSDQEGFAETNVDSSWLYQTEDTNLEITKVSNYQLDNPSDIAGISQTLDFSKFISDHLKGDINNDGKDDLVITAIVAGGR